MKTNTIGKSILTLLLVLIVCSFALPALADTEKQNESSSLIADAGKEETGEPETAVTPDTEAAAPVKPGKKDGKNRPERPVKDGRDESRKASRRHGFDFSELPDDPTDEEIVEFFKKYFMGKDPAGTPDRGKNDEAESGRPGKGHRPFGGQKDERSKPFGGHKGFFCRPDAPEAEGVPEAPESVPEAPEAAPVEEQPADTVTENIG